jgi:hypothetical protein
MFLIVYFSTRNERDTYYAWGIHNPKLISYNIKGLTVIYHKHTHYITIISLTLFPLLSSTSLILSKFFVILSSNSMNVFLRPIAP